MTQWTPRFSSPLILARGLDTEVFIEVWGPTGIQEPTAGTITLVDPDGSEVVTSQALTVNTTDHRAYTTIAAASIPNTTELSENWSARWTLDIGGDSDQLFVQDAQVVISPWKPTITAGDLEATCSGVRHIFNMNDPKDLRKLYNLIQAACHDTQARLTQSGYRPSLIIDSWKLNSYVISVCLARIFRGALAAVDPANLQAYTELCTRFEGDAETRWNTMNFKYKTADSIAPSDVRTRSASATIRLGMGR